MFVKYKTNKMQKFIPLKPLSFCLLFEKNKEFWILGIHPRPLCPKSKTKNKFMIINKKPIKMKLIEKYFLNSLPSVAPRCTLLPLVVGAYNTVYAVHSLHFALPYFASLRFAKHRIYSTLCSLHKEFTVV